MSRHRKILTVFNAMIVAFLVISLIISCEWFEPERIIVVRTGLVTDVSQTSCTVEGTILDKGKTGIIDQHGFCWAKHQYPEITDDCIDLGSRDLTGNFSGDLTGLSPNSIYYVRAYAKRHTEISYGNLEHFITLQTGEPTVTTASVSSITDTSAVCGGNVTDDGGATVTSRGVCWDTSENPTISDSTTSDGSGTGSFTSILTGLSCETTYYIRSYATNSEGTVYGSQENFTTSSCPPELPEVSTSFIENIGQTSATCGGDVTDDGGGEVSARGICWSTSQNPTTSDSITIDGDGTGSFTGSITELSNNTIYYVCAYATNEAGTAYGSVIKFRTLLDTFSDYDGNIYNTIQIGNQVWMAENLKTTHYTDGTEIPLAESTTDWDNLTETSKAYCYYDNSTSNKDTYGALYTWTAVMNNESSSDANPSGVQGVCPGGWHVPSDNEWKELEIYLGMSQDEADRKVTWRGTDEGGKLKEASHTYWNYPYLGATNETGFTALPGGVRGLNGSFAAIGSGGSWWSSTDTNLYYAWMRSLSYTHAKVWREEHFKHSGHSVRCIRDE